MTKELSKLSAAAVHAVLDLNDARLAIVKGAMAKIKENPSDETTLDRADIIFEICGLIDQDMAALEAMQI